MPSFRHEHLTFDYLEWESPSSSAETVVLLHGFPQTVDVWDPIAAELNRRGFRVLALSQRGYSLGARPCLPTGYVARHLLSDIEALREEAGVERFHLVGHDWGAAIGWLYAITKTERLLTFTALSTPHPRAVLRAGLSGEQVLRLWYMPMLMAPGLMGAALRVSSGRFGIFLLRQFGLTGSAAVKYVRNLRTDRRALTGALNWYRAGLLDSKSFFERRPVPPTVPTLYIWGSHDVTVSRKAADLTKDFVAGSYRMVVIADGTHWLPEDSSKVLLPELIRHLSST